MGVRQVGRSAAARAAANAGNMGTRSGASMGAAAAAEGFFTDFTRSKAESPISEKGLWITNDAGLWTPVEQDGAHAYATHAGTTDFKDSYMYVNPAAIAFNANQRAKIILYQASLPSGFTEYEILLRVVTNVVAHTVTLVECNLAKDGQYAEIIGWKGPLGTTSPGDFEFYSTGNPVAGVADGGVFEAQIVGNTVSTFYNGSPITTASISGSTVPHPTGQVGFGGFTTSGSATEMKKIGIKYFQGWSL